ncbi:polyprenyl synthetase family protein [Amycolatopsis sp. NPDC049868]|uniref:polyprenyl synthetase family protein n=1 Tax=Amycolatopsis sp. NPDC049868 TaxID=3363934 RepID=UPI00378ECABD
MTSTTSIPGPIEGRSDRRRTVQETLADCREVVSSALRAAVDTLPESLCAVAGYHFGWLDQRGRPAEADCGKLLRPALVLSSAEAVGGQAEAVVPAATAVELVHAFSLLHDDVMDGDRQRRHRPTVWAAFGVPTAVLAGDALLALALRVLAESGHSGASASLAALSEAVAELISGQSADMDFETRGHVAVDECEVMAAGKTGALLGCASAMGAQLGGGNRRQVECLREFGEQMGMAFQLVDDLLGIGGDHRVTGKSVGADLARRKKSLPVVFALSSGTAASAELARLYRLERPMTASEVISAATAVEAAGGMDWARREADRRMTEALSRLRDADLAPGPVADLKGLADLIVHRDR